MKPNILFLPFTFLLICINAFSQDTPNTIRFVDLNTFKWGIKDLSGKTIVEPQYSSINSFKNRRYVVSKTPMQQGMIDEEGKEILPSEYFSIYDEAKDTIIVRKDGKSGILNSSLERILPIKYTSVLKQKNFYIVRENHLSGILDADFNQTVPFIYSTIFHPSSLKSNHFLVEKDSKYGLIDISNNIIIPIEYDFLSFMENFDCYTGGKENQSTIFDLAGNTVFSKDNKGINILTKDRFAVKNDKNLWGVFDGNSNQKINYQYKAILSSSKNFYIAQNSQLHWGAINDDNKIIISFEYSEPFSFDGETAFVKDRSGKYGFIDQKGTVTTQFKYDNAVRFSNGYILVKINNRSGLVNKKGKEIIEPYYDFINAPVNNIVIAGKDKKYYFLRLDNLSSDLKKEYDYIQDFMYDYDKDLILIKKNGLYGFINLHGNMVIPAIYENARAFTDNYASVKLNNETFLINKKGEKLVVK